MSFPGMAMLLSTVLSPICFLIPPFPHNVVEVGHGGELPYAYYIYIYKP